MTNSFNHSCASNVSLTLRQEGNQYEIKLADDGIGFDFADVEPNGLKNMQVRADRMGATLQIESGKGSGTTIRLFFLKTKTTMSWLSLQKKEF
jgi:signal transduction histidine kinase